MTKKLFLKQVLIPLESGFVGREYTQVAGGEWRGKHSFAIPHLFYFKACGVAKGYFFCMCH